MTVSAAIRERARQFVERGTAELDVFGAARLRRLHAIALLAIVPQVGAPICALVFLEPPTSELVAAVAVAVWIGWIESNRAIGKAATPSRITLAAHFFIALSMLWVLTLVFATGLATSPWLFMLVSCPAVAAYVTPVRGTVFWTVISIGFMVVLHLVDGPPSDASNLVFSPLAAQICVTLIVTSIASASHIESQRHLVELEEKRSELGRQAAQLARQNEMLTRHAELDLSKRKQVEAELAHRRLHDHLTGLPNRRMFLSRVEQALKDIDEATQVAVLFVDIDQFKIVNDSLGHAVGDELLIAVAERLREGLDGVDTITRLGGDEFAMLVSCGDDPSRAAATADRVQALFDEPFLIDAHEVSTTVSIGIAMAGDVEQPPEDLMRHADAAMYRAKAEGRGTARFFDETARAHLRSRFETAAALNQALARKELRVYYQPEVDLRSERILGVEALVRWEHPTRGLLTAGEFVQLAEETGLIVRIGEWVLREAFLQAKRWHDGEDASLHVRINVSPNQLYKGDLVERVAALLEETGVEPGCICLEVTESALLEFGTEALTTLEQLRSLGVRLAIDDFGTGYSSLSYLKQIPADTLKVDRSFVRNLETDEKDRSIVAAVLDLARDLGFGAVVEGVETVGQVALLRELGCTNAQGFLFSRAVPEYEITELLRKGGSVGSPRLMAEEEAAG